MFLKIFLSGSWAVGPFPSEAALDLHLSQIPDELDVEWVLVPYSLDDTALGWCAAAGRAIATAEGVRGRFAVG